MNLIYKMESQYKLKYPDFFRDLLKFQDTLCLCLKIYLSMHNVSFKKKELISLIKQVKTKMKKSPKKKLDIEFHEIFCELVENVVLNFSDGDLSNHVIDNYSLAQISLCSIVVQWIKTKGEVVLEKKEINKVFEIIYNFIKKEYGQEFFELIKIMGLYDHNKLKEIISPKEAISNASIIVKNVHPSYLNSSVNAFILGNYEKYKKYGINSLDIIPEEKYLFKKNYIKILNIIIIAQKMEKYQEKRRFDFFTEFRNQKDYLEAINFILSKMNKKPLSNLSDEKEDINLILEHNNDLVKENKEFQETSEKLLKDLDTKKNYVNDLKKNINDLTKNINDLEVDLNNKIDEIKKLKNKNKVLTDQLLEVNLSLNQAEKKIENHLPREVCSKIENYFYNILSPTSRQQVDKELEDKKKFKIDVYISKINEEYPKYFTKIKNEGIDYTNFLYYINTFRLKNNEECHDKTKVNPITIIDILNDYFDKKFDFKKPLEFMYDNFEEFKVYIFSDRYQLNNNLFSIFKKIEEDSKK